MATDFPYQSSSLGETEARASNLVRNIKDAVDNTTMSDAEFRQWVKDAVAVFPDWFWKTRITLNDFVSKKKEF